MGISGVLLVERPEPDFVAWGLFWKRVAHRKETCKVQKDNRSEFQ